MLSRYLATLLASSLESAALILLVCSPARAALIDDFSSGPIVVELNSGGGGSEFNENQTEVNTPTGQRRIIMSGVPVQVANPWSVGLQIGGMADIAISNAAGIVAFQYNNFSEFNLADAITNGGFSLLIGADARTNGAIGDATIEITSGRFRSEVTKELFVDALTNLFFPFSSFNLLPNMISNLNGSIELRLRSDLDSAFRIHSFSTASSPIPEPTSVFICSVLAILLGAFWRLRSVISR